MKDKLAKKGELYANVDDGHADARLPARQLRARDAHHAPTRRARSGKDGFLFKVQIPPQRVLVGELRRRWRAGAGRTSKSSAPRTRRRRAVADRDRRRGVGRERAAAGRRPGSRCTRSTGAAWSTSAALRFQTGIVAGRAAGGGPALVHGGVRARQPAHQLPGAAVRARAGGDDAAGAGAAPGRAIEDPFRDEEPGRSCTSSAWAR